MKKLLVLVAVLSLIAGTAFAADLNDGLTKAVYAQGKGRSVVSDGSVVMKVWYTGSSTGAVGVSGNAVLKLYSEYIAGTATTIDTSAAAYDTVGELVDYINGSVTSFAASVGNDGYRALDSKYLLADSITLTPTLTAPKSIYLDCSTAKYITCGVEAKDNRIPRIKRIDNIVSGTNLNTLSVYEGDTRIWRRDIVSGQHNSATSYGASTNSILFTTTGDKGIAGSMDTPFVVKSAWDSSFGTSSPTANKTAEGNLSIEYDYF